LRQKKLCDDGLVTFRLKNADTGYNAQKTGVELRITATDRMFRFCILPGVYFVLYHRFLKNPYAQPEGIARQKISYKRADGIDLTADLYLPKGYDPKRDGLLPVLIAYPGSTSQLLMLHRCAVPSIHGEKKSF
jgi:hypothetical protein